MVSEISKTEKDTYCIVSSICGIYKSQTYRNRVELWLPGAGGRENGVALFKRYKVSVMSHEKLLEICRTTFCL